VPPKFLARNEFRLLPLLPWKRGVLSCFLMMTVMAFPPIVFSQHATKRVPNSMPNENDPSRRMFVICYYGNTVLYCPVEYIASFLLLSHTIETVTPFLLLVFFSIIRLDNLVGKSSVLLDFRWRILIRPSRPILCFGAPATIKHYYELVLVIALTHVVATY